MIKKELATIYDVAAQAEVSIATVSRVLNAPERVNAATRSRVLETIDALGFVPRAEASARARKAAGRIGVLAPFFTYPSFVQRLHGVAMMLAGSPYELVIYNVDSAQRRDGYLASLAVTHRLDGLIVMALPLDETMGQRLVTHKLETVLIESTHPALCGIQIDNLAGGRLAAEYLAARGHRRCAFVGDESVPNYALHNSDLRLQGYRQGLADAQIPLPDIYVALGPNGLDQARALTHRLLDLPQPPTAIFAVSDTQAAGVLRAACERGVTVPDQLAVIGFDDVELAEHLGLTTVHQPLEESGRIAVELLIARLADRERSPQHIQLPLHVVTRTTA